jgi:Ca2+-transporting ATPase
MILLKNMKKLYHNISEENIVKILNSDFKMGLKKEEVLKRKLCFQKKKKTKYLFLKQFKRPLMYVLMFASALYFFSGEYNSLSVVVFAILFYSLFYYSKEKRVLNAFEEKTKVCVLRDGREKEVLKDELVIGDIVCLREGDVIPRHARLLESNGLKVLEYEEDWVLKEKNTGVLAKRTLPKKRENILFQGSLVKEGSAKAIVLEEELEREGFVFERKMQKLNWILGIVVVLLCILILAFALFVRGLDCFYSVEMCMALLVSAMPEILFISFILALFKERLLKGNVLIKNLACIDKLGKMSVLFFNLDAIVSGRARLKQIIAEDGDLALKVYAFCFNVKLPKKYDIDLDVEELRRAQEKGYALSLRKEKNVKTLYICGAPEQVFLRSKNAKEWEEEVNRLREKGLKVYAVALKEIKRVSRDLKDSAKNFEFKGLVAFKESLKGDVMESIESLKKSGIRPVLGLNGDDLYIEAVAKNIGVEVSSQFKQEKEVIGGMGRGDVVFSLGSQKEALKETSDLVLMNNSLEAVSLAVQEGKVVLSNLKRAFRFYILNMFVFIGLMGVSFVFNLPFPILAIHIFLISIIKSIFLYYFAFEKKVCNSYLFPYAFLLGVFLIPNFASLLVVLILVVDKVCISRLKAC